MHKLLISFVLLLLVNSSFAGDLYLICHDVHLDLAQDTLIEDGKTYMNLVMPEGEKVEIFLTDVGEHLEEKYFVKIKAHADAPDIGLFIKFWDIFYVGQYECFVRD
jgi:hypothetical protein